MSSQWISGHSRTGANKTAGLTGSLKMAAAAIRMSGTTQNSANNQFQPELVLDGSEGL
jgi:hypothetical protein